MKNKYYNHYLKNRKQIKGSPINKDALPEHIMADKLVNLAESILKNPKYSKEFKHIASKLNIGFDDIINSVLFYTLDLNKVENTDYFNDYAMRTCMYLHSLVKGSYHLDKHSEVKKIMSSQSIKTAIEFGCGFPASYVFKAKLLKQKITLTDYDQSALDFCKTVLAYHDKHYQDNIHFKTVDINKMENPGKFDAYIMLDSLEHTINPSEYLKRLVANMQVGSHLITSLPIGKIDTMSHAHYIEFLNEKSIVDWLEEAGLKVISTKQCKPNLEVDYFASLMVGGYVDLIVDAIK